MLTMGGAPAGGRHRLRVAIHRRRARAAFFHNSTSRPSSWCACSYAARLRRLDPARASGCKTPLASRTEPAKKRVPGRSALASNTRRRVSIDQSIGRDSAAFIRRAALHQSGSRQRCSPEFAARARRRGAAPRIKHLQPIKMAAQLGGGGARLRSGSRVGTGGPGAAGRRARERSSRCSRIMRKRRTVWAWRGSVVCVRRSGSIQKRTCDCSASAGGGRQKAVHDFTGGVERGHVSPALDSLEKLKNSVVSHELCDPSNLDQKQFRDFFKFTFYLVGKGRTGPSKRSRGLICCRSRSAADRALKTCAQVPRVRPPQHASLRSWARSSSSV